MILTYMIMGSKGNNNIWERNTDTGLERCIYDSDEHDSNKKSYPDWISPDDIGGTSPLPDMVKNGDAKKISRADALLEIL